MEDWKSRLAALGASLPEGPAEEGVGSTESEVNSQVSRKDTLNVVMERKGRGGKTATIIEGFTIPDTEVAEIARRLRSHLGTGGSARGGEILVQGDHRAKVSSFLRGEGFKVKGGF